MSNNRSVKTLNIQARRAGRCLVIRPQGELDLGVAGEFREKVEAELAKDGLLTHLILDLAEVRFIDSSGLGVILGRYKKLSQKGGRVVVVGMSSQVRKVFELSGMFRIIDEAATVDDALAALAGVV